MDVASWLVVVITFALFALAVVEKGLTHDLLLEAGVFLVSVKLIMMNAKMGRASQETRARLEAIQASVDRSNADRHLPTSTPSAASPPCPAAPTPSPSPTPKPSP
jgi:hypothetical protein